MECTHAPLQGYSELAHFTAVARDYTLLSVPISSASKQKTGKGILVCTPVDFLLGNYFKILNSTVGWWGFFVLFFGVVFLFALVFPGAESTLHTASQNSSFPFSSCTYYHLHLLKEASAQIKFFTSAHQLST